MLVVRRDGSSGVVSVLILKGSDVIGGCDGGCVVGGTSSHGCGGGGVGIRCVYVVG